MVRQSNILRGGAAGAARGLVAAFVMGWFMTGPGNELEAFIDRLAGKPVGPTQNGIKAALKVADALQVPRQGKTSAPSNERKHRMRYTSSLVWCLGHLGAVAEIAPAVGSSVEVGFGSALFVGSGFPALKLGQDNDELKPCELGASYAAHVG